jgi:large subunit ribosomal protein L3
MKFIIGTKQHMTQVFDEHGVVHPVTIVTADPMVVTQVKDAQRDGYSALQFGVGRTKARRVAQPQQGHAAPARQSAGVSDEFAYLHEYRLHNAEPELTVGDGVDVSSFAVGDAVTVAATSKAKGFQGGVKRHGFSGQDRTHGTKHAHREIGSIGAMGVQEVRKGKRMPGRMGGNRVTVKNLQVVAVDSDEQALYISGAVPGKKGSHVEIYGHGDS